jgi:oxygen-dependent protoporphyrinogen oxidase
VFEGMSQYDAIVIGGGFAGLTAAHYLRKAGWRVVVIEAADEVGGRVRTVRKQGYAIDVGATQMSSGYRQYLELCDELGLGDQMHRSCPYVGMLREGRIHAIDARSLLASALTPALSWRGKLSLLNTVRDALAIKPPVDVFDVSRSHVADVESAADYARRRLSPEAGEFVVDPLMRCYVMNSAEKVSALEWFSTLRNLGGQTMLSLNGGNDRLPKALARALDVRLRTQAVSLTRTSGGVAVVVRDHQDREERLEARTCVMATRLHEALAIDPALKPTVGALGEKLLYNRAWVVHLGYRVAPALKVVGSLIPARERPEVGLLWLEHNKNPDRVPVGHALFSIYSDEAQNHRCYGAPDAELIALATSFVEKLFPELRGQQDMTNVTRWPCAIPNPSPGIYKEVAAMKARLDPASPVQLAGDYLTCTGQNSAIYYGKQAAEALITRHGTGPFAPRQSGAHSTTSAEACPSG